MVELTHIDIVTGVSLLASQMAQPREDCLDPLFHYVAFLNLHHNSCIVYDLSDPEISLIKFKNWGWVNFYGGGKEAIPLNAMDGRTKEVDL
jgi:hypothetical protein